MSFILRYKYTFGLLLSILIAAVLFGTGVFHQLVKLLDGFGYVSAFFAGLLFPFTFTAAPAGLFLLEIGASLNPVLTALLAGVGAMLADLLMFRFIKGSILKEMQTLMKSIVPMPTLARMEHVTKKRMWRWTMPFLGSLLIASPLPDELGIAIFSIINFRPKYLLVITYILNTLGIFGLVFLGSTIGS